jgi:hypothetical protein
MYNNLFTISANVLNSLQNIYFHYLLVGRYIIGANAKVCAGRELKPASCPQDK